MISGWLADERMRTRTGGKGAARGGPRPGGTTESVGRKEYTSWCAEQGEAGRCGVGWRSPGVSWFGSPFCWEKEAGGATGYGHPGAATPERARA
jgi:hypothetical protein